MALLKAGSLGLVRSPGARTARAASGFKVPQLKLGTKSLRPIGLQPCSDGFARGGASQASSSGTFPVGDESTDGAATQFHLITQARKVLCWIQHAINKILVHGLKFAASVALLVTAWSMGSKPAMAQPVTWDRPSVTSSTLYESGAKSTASYRYSGMDLAELPAASTSSTAEEPLANLLAQGDVPTEAVTNRINAMLAMYDDGKDLGLKQYTYADNKKSPSSTKGGAQLATASDDFFSSEFGEGTRELHVFDQESLAAALSASGAVTELDPSQLWALVSRGHIEKVAYAGQNAETLFAFSKRSAPGGPRMFSVHTRGDQSALMDHFISHGVKIETRVPEVQRLYTALRQQVLRYFMPFFLFSILFWNFFTSYLNPSPNGFRRREFIRYKKNLMNISTKLNFRSPAREVRIDTNSSDFIKWDDISGIDDVKKEVAEVIEYLKNPGMLKAKGISRIGGLLLAGAPGTGKTLLAKSIAAESGVQMFTCSGTDFFDVYSGVGARRIRETFEKLRNAAPAILFIDEFDALGAARGTASSGDESASIINEMLVQMDGFEDNRGMVVMGATNRPGAIDAALIRPGRFDRIVYMPLPDAEGRAKIMQVHARNKVVDEGLNWSEVAKAMSGFTGADCMGLMRRGQLMAEKKGRVMILEEDLYAAMEDKAIEAYAELTNSPIPGEDSGVPDTIPPYLRRVLASYEAGKALMAYITPDFEEIARVSITPASLITSYTLFVEDEAKGVNAILTRAEMEAHMVVNLAGRQAEKMTIGEHQMTGISGSDLFHANNVAREMVLEFGLGKRTGPVDLMTMRPQKEGKPLDERNSGPPEDEAYFHSSDMSTEQARQSMGEIAEILASAEAKAVYGLAINWKAFMALSDALLERGTLMGKEVAQICQSNGVVHFPDPYIEGFGWREDGELLYPLKPDQPSTSALNAKETDATVAQVLHGVKGKTRFAGTPFDAPRDADGNFLQGWHWNIPIAPPRQPWAQTNYRIKEADPVP